MIGEDAHLEAQYEDQQAPEVEDLEDEYDEEETCDLCGGWPGTCDEQVDGWRARWIG